MPQKWNALLQQLGLIEWWIWYSNFILLTFTAVTVRPEFSGWPDRVAWMDWNRSRHCRGRALLGKFLTVYPLRERLHARKFCPMQGEQNIEYLFLFWVLPWPCLVVKIQNSKSITSNGNLPWSIKSKWNKKINYIVSCKLMSLIRS